ncbi:MAG: hypothetical protein N2513_00750, partial [Deltaproteobacteria bacterium]|nr:hypothetical protein [Deltaproteobacteria bacterium]
VTTRALFQRNCVVLWLEMASRSGRVTTENSYDIVVGNVTLKWLPDLEGLRQKEINLRLLLKVFFGCQ